MTAAERMDLIRRSWWASPPPRVFVLDRHGKPIGVLCRNLDELRERGRVQLVALPPRAAQWEFVRSFPGEIWADMPRVELEPIWHNRLFWRLVYEIDGGCIDDVDGFWPTIDPLPDFRFLAQLAEIQKKALFRKILRKAAAALDTPHYRP